MKNLLTIFFLTLMFTAVGQTTFNYTNDFKSILARTKDSADNLFYEKLLTRFNANDTTLTDFEVLCLMIGFTDQPEYKPYQDISTEREIYNMNGEGKYREALESGMEFIQAHPLSVKTLFEIAYAYHNLDNEDSAQIYVQRGRRIFDAMYFSGNAKTPETAAFALGPADGQDFIYKFVGADIGMMGSGSDDNGNFLDILEAKLDNGKSIQLYFNVQHATDKMFSGEDMKKIEDTMKKSEKSKEDDE